MKRIIKTIALILIIAVVVVTSGNILNWKTSADFELFNCDNFYSSPANSMDVITYGSSHAFCSMNNALLWENYGIAGYNFAAACQNPGNTYIYMQESLKTQRPKVMLVECFYFANFGYGDGDLYRNVLNLKYSKNYIDNLKYALTISGGNGGDFSDLMLKWPIIHSRYNSLSRQDYYNYEDFLRGYRMFTDYSEQAAPESIYTTNVTAPSDENIMYLDKMVELANDNSIPIIFWASPYILDNTHMEIYNWMEQYLNAKGVPFINFNKPDNYAGIDYASDFIEASHLNYRGANKVTDFLGTYLAVNYDFSEHSDNSIYTSWDKDLSFYKERIDEYELSQATDISNAALILNRTPDTIVMCYNPNELSDLQRSFLTSCFPTLSVDTINTSGALIIKDGALLGNAIYGQDYYLDIDYNALTYTASSPAAVTNIAGTNLPDSKGIMIVLYNDVYDSVSAIRAVTSDGYLL